MSGRVELIIGPMFAGKTTELMRRVRREMYARRSCFVIKYAKDTRYSADDVASHDKSTLRAGASVSRLSDVGDRWSSSDVIAIDEAQFFPDLIDFVRNAADSGKTIILSALDGDFQRKPFGSVCELVALCESVTKLSSVCMVCHSNDAAFTRRTVSSTRQELIGGSEIYAAVCRRCYLSPCPPPSPSKHLKTTKEIELMMTVEAASSDLSPDDAPTMPAAKKARQEVFPP